MAPGADGGLYVSVSEEVDVESERSTVAAYDGRGEIRPGWPIAVSDTAACTLASAADGNLWAVCGMHAYSFDPAGRLLPGWPVDLPGYPNASRLIDGQLHMILAGGLLARIAADGTLVVGAAGFGGDLIGADGTGFSVRRSQDCEADTTITATDLTGVRLGWPIRVPCGSSDPVSGPDGRVFVVEGSWDGDVSHILAFERDGRPVAGWSVELPGSAPHVGSWADPYIPAPPLVAADGTVWFATETTAYAVHATGPVRPGWPYRSSVSLEYVGYCGPCDIDCYLLPSRPLIGPDDVLYLLQGAPSGAVGGQITAVGPDGAVRDGWPVVLHRPGVTFDSVVAGADGTVYAKAIEPEGSAEPPKGACFPPASATILAIGPDGRVRYRVTVVEP
jgi:hypothetical protein